MSKYVALIFLLISPQSFADPLAYWTSEIPAPNSARNVSFDKDHNFYTMTVDYEIDVADVESQYDFYNDYFATLGWVNPYEQYARSKSTSQAGWSSYQLTFNKVENHPEAVYASVWKAQESGDVPVSGKVLLTLTEYKNDVFTASVKVVVGPEINIPAMLELNQLLSGDAKRFFHLYNALGVSPFELMDAVKTRAESESSNETVQQYYKIVDKILIHYKKFGEEYMGEE